MGKIKEQLAGIAALIGVLPYGDKFVLAIIQSPPSFQHYMLL